MIRITRSAVLGAPVEQVWPLLRDFGGWHAWHAGLASSQVDRGAADAVGAVRRLRLRTGEHLREQLIALSDREMSGTWCLIEASNPLDPYVATLRLRRVTHGDCCFLEWRLQADGPLSRQSAAERFLGETLCDPAIAGLQGRFRSASLLSAGEKVDHVQREADEGSGRAAKFARPPIRPLGAPSLPSEEGIRPASHTGDQVMNSLAVVVERHGGPEVLRTTRVTVPPPGPGEVRLRHAFIGVNMIDVHGRAGEFGLGSLPAVPGMEGAGTIVDVGPGVAHLRAGDRVAYAGRPPGAYAEARSLPAAIAVPLPPDLDARMAAASLLKGITADLLLHDVHPLQPGELVLVHAAAGGLGLVLCGWAKALGATVIGVVSRDSKVDAAAAAGCAAVIVSSREDVAQAVREMTGGRGVDVVFDAIGRATFEASLASLAPSGHLVSFGQVSGRVSAGDVDRLASRSIRISSPNFAEFVDTPDTLRRRADRLFAILRTGRVRPVIDSVWPLPQAAEAHRRLESRDTIGSVLLSPEIG
jgi:NADPH2:quinone reductase